MAESRQPVRRFYVDGNVLTVRVKDAADATIPLTNIAPDVVSRLAIEGVISLVQGKASIADILTGAAFPDRSLPNSEAVKEPSAWVRAIAAVRGMDIIKQARSGGAKPTSAEQDAMREQALAWAKRLTEAQVNHLRKTSALVRQEHGRLTGKGASIDDLLAELDTTVHAAPAEEAPAEAAE